MSRRWASRLVLSAAAGLLVIPLATPAAAASAIDVQANSPQVAGDPASDTTAVFPTNKQNETSVAVNPLDDRLLISGANDEQRQPACGPGPVRGPGVDPSDCSFFPGVGTSGVYTSSDGGKSWTNRGLLDDQPSWKASDFVSDGDPVISYGPKPQADGSFSYAKGARAYYSSLASYKPGRSPYPPNKAPELLAVAYSDDNGLTWSAPVIATVKENPNDFNDKEWVTVDASPTSPYFGQVYLTWTEFRAAGQSEPVMVSVSRNGGRSYSLPKQLSPAGNNGTGNGRQGSMPTVGPDGTVYVGWEEGSQQLVSVSRDGGSRWARPVSAGSVVDIHDPIPGSNFRTNSFLSIAADPRPGSTSVWAAWVNRTPDGGRVVVVRSTDRGATWSAPETVSGGAEGYAFYQGLAVAPNGRVDVGYQAQKAKDPTTYGTGNAAIDAWYVARPDGGGWSSPVKVSGASSDPAVSAQNNLARQFMGDYNTMASTAKKAWFITTDARRGAGCPAVDAYQHEVEGTSVVRGDMRDRIATRLGKDPYAADPLSKPAPPLDCPAQFGNTDAYVAVITP
ncbi:exo-alpha-sialidase [Streptomyces sp. TRM66268-LWL]|uniref:Exo-alpha-sialidase n=1 Tax=Streptomyces polyasparticus TaxID=2767826 RepID=A0ABR7SAE6_9ACTN|nr:sialidase family protein [Streptomyces polyasparticus]MBC9711974.1 exo-alpha-sialidase [Streptomyces polyasparticus]